MRNNKEDAVAFNKKVRVTDPDSGKVIYNNSDVVDMAAFSIKRCGTGVHWNKIEYASISIRCTKCGHLADRFVHQIKGFFCHKCQEYSDGLNYTIDDITLEKINKCQTYSNRADEQSLCVTQILLYEIKKHNNRYKYLRYGEPTIFHKILYKLKSFLIGQSKLFKELFNKGDF